MLIIYTTIKTELFMIVSIVLLGFASIVDINHVTRNLHMSTYSPRNRLIIFIDEKEYVIIDTLYKMSHNQGN